MNWLGWQIDYLLCLQNFRETTNHIFDDFFLTITTFGEVTIPVLFICILYWCINKKAGIYILFNYLFGFISNLFLKMSACIYRPWILDCNIQPLDKAIPEATGYSFPSGHTAGATSIWGGTAIYFWKQKWIRYACLSIVFLVMFSRNYVGVHTPQDVLVSFFIGIILLLFSKKLFEWEAKDKNRDLVIANSITILTILLLLYINFKTYPMDFIDGKLLFDPTPAKLKAYGYLGFVLGVFYGWIIEKRFINFSPDYGNLTNKIIRFLIGGGILYIILLCGKSLFTHLFSYIPGIFINHLLIGLYITAIYPYFINKKIF